MPYTTPAEVRLALVPTSNGLQPSPVSHTAADLADSQLTDSIAEADSIIDSYIGRFYAVPVAVIIAGQSEDGTTPGAVPHPVDYWSRNIAAYLATLSFRGSADFADQDPVARRYNLTMDALNKVAAGTAKLQLPDNTSPSTGVGVGTAINPYVGDLFGPSDWDLRPMPSGLPTWRDGRGGAW